MKECDKATGFVGICPAGSTQMIQHGQLQQCTVHSLSLTNAAVHRVAKKHPIDKYSQHSVHGILERRQTDALRLHVVAETKRRQIQV